jgi:excinuclease ABC subunit A
MKNTDEKNGTEIPSPYDIIEVLGAREHNLKNIDIVIPKNKLVVITGISGSGKSSLAFDTIYAEGVIWKLLGHMPASLLAKWNVLM